MIQIDIEGVPIPWMRPGIIRQKKSNVVYDRQRHEKELVRWQMRSQYVEEPLGIPLAIAILFRMPIPKSTSGPIKRDMLHGMIHHMKKPDIDNLCKFLLDCMNGLVFVDDSQIYDLRGTKIYSTRPGSVIRITAQSSNPKYEEIEDGSDLRDDGGGDLFGDHIEQKRPSAARRKEDRIIPF